MRFRCCNRICSYGCCWICHCFPKTQHKERRTRLRRWLSTTSWRERLCEVCLCERTRARCAHFRRVPYEFDNQAGAGTCQTWPKYIVVPVLIRFRRPCTSLLLFGFPRNDSSTKVSLLHSFIFIQPWIQQRPHQRRGRWENWASPQCFSLPLHPNGDHDILAAYHQKLDTPTVAWRSRRRLRGLL